MATIDQPTFELIACVLRKALADFVGTDEPKKIQLWEELDNYSVSPSNLPELIGLVDLTPFNEEGFEPISEVTIQDIEFIFYEKNWEFETVGSLIPYLIRLVAYKKSQKEIEKDPRFIQHREKLESYKRNSE